MKKYQLNKGDEIDEERYEKIISDLFAYEFNYVVKWLGMRDRTEQEIRNRLTLRMIKNRIIEDIILKLKDLKYIDNERLKGNIIRELFNRGYGKYHIEKILRIKNIEFGSDDFLSLIHISEPTRPY